MSDYEVNLVNDCMQEFYVRFYGPAESKFPILPLPFPEHLVDSAISTIRGWRMEDSRRTARSIPLQVPKYRVHE